MKKLILSGFVLASLMLASCGDDDSTSTPEIVKDGIISSQDDDDLDASDLQGKVQANITLSGEYILTGPLAVKSGYTLTIEPGTTIKAIAGGTNVYIVVEMGAMIDAEGTASNPIVMTSNAGNPRSGDWGGLLLIGDAPISGGGTATTEVITLTYGGTNAASNQGTLKYVEVSYTGARINSDKEFNGITFYAVGNGTTIENVAVMNGDDDAYEWFGGTVNVTKALAVDVKDDIFDWTQGWTGTATSFYGIRTAEFTAITEDPRGLEGDGNLDGNSPGDSGQSNPTFNNLTIINDGIIEFTDMIKIRRGSGVTITNGYVEIGAEGSADDFIDLTDSKGDALGTAVNISVIGNNVNLTDIKWVDDAGQTSPGTVSATAGTTPTVDGAGIFGWTSFTF